MSDGKVNAIDGMGNATIVAMKEDAQAFDFDQRRRGHFCFSVAAAIALSMSPRSVIPAGFLRVGMN
jgi:hypothetical protein